MMPMIMIVMIVFMKKIIRCLMFECSSVSVEEKGDEGMRQRRERTSAEAEKPWWDEDLGNGVQIFLNGGSEPILIKLLIILIKSKREIYCYSVAFIWFENVNGFSFSIYQRGWNRK